MAEYANYGPGCIPNEAQERPGQPCYSEGNEKLTFRKLLLVRKSGAVYLIYGREKIYSPFRI